jgi:Asp-tRNA(Asn)/Glu-tRNA(Gln) amidotransferase A subunit family amidase
MNESGVHVAFAELANGIAAKRLSSVEVVDAVSRRIERADPRLNAYRHLRLNEPRAVRARAAAERAPTGDPTTAASTDRSGELS